MIYSYTDGAVTTPMAYGATLLSIFFWKAKKGRDYGLIRIEEELISWEKTNLIPVMKSKDRRAKGGKPNCRRPISPPSNIISLSSNINFSRLSIPLHRQFFWCSSNENNILSLWSFSRQKRPLCWNGVSHHETSMPERWIWRLQARLISKK